MGPKKRGGVSHKNRRRASVQIGDSSSLAAALALLARALTSSGVVGLALSLDLGNGDGLGCRLVGS